MEKSIVRHYKAKRCHFRDDDAFFAQKMPKSKRRKTRAIGEKRKPDKAKRPALPSQEPTYLRKRVFWKKKKLRYKQQRKHRTSHPLVNLITHRTCDRAFKNGSVIFLTEKKMDSRVTISLKVMYFEAARQPKKDLYTHIFKKELLFKDAECGHFFNDVSTKLLTHKMFFLCLEYFLMLRV